jgi:hypothetical protein
VRSIPTFEKVPDSVLVLAIFGPDAQELANELYAFRRSGMDLEAVLSAKIKVSLTGYISWPRVSRLELFKVFPMPKYPSRPLVNSIEHLLWSAALRR